MKHRIALNLAAAMILSLIPLGCAQVPAERNLATERAEHQQMVSQALALFDPKNPSYDPDKGKAHLERILQKGRLQSLDLPTPIVLALLRSEKDAHKRRRDIERRMTNIKRIDLETSEEVK